MTRQPIIANPIGWVQFKLLGGWRTQLSFLAAYCGAVAMLHIVVYEALARTSSVLIPQFAAGAFAVMTFLFAAIFLLGGTAAIKKAIQRDYTTAMIGSHRLGAMSGNTAVLGYLTGPTAQVLLITAVNWLTCTILAILAGTPISPFVPTGLLAILLCWAAMFWPLSVLIGFGTRGKTPVGGLIALLVVLGSIGATEIWPGLALLFCSANGPALAQKASVNLADPSAIVSLLGLIVFGQVFFAAAARRFARDDVQSFTPVLAGVVLALAALFSAIGLAYWPRGSSMSPLTGADLMQPSNKLVASLIGVCIVAFLPVKVAAKNAACWARRRAKDPAYAVPRPRSFVETPAVATLIVFVIWLAVLSGEIPTLFGGIQRADALRRLLWMAAPFLTALLTVAGLLRFVYAYTNKGFVILTIYLCLIWLFPVLTDIAIEVALDRGPHEPTSAIFACSPVGMWLATIKDINAPLIPGLVFQVVLAVAALVLSRRAR